MNSSRPTRQLASADAVERRDRIIEAFRPLVPKIAGRIHRQRPHVTTREDLEQAGYVGLLAAIGQVDAYLCQRVEGAMKDSCKSKRDFAEASHARHEDIAPMADPRGNLLDRCVLLSEVFDAIAGLAAPEAEVLLLVAQCDSQAEVGVALGITQQGVSKRHKRAVEQVREKLAA